MKKLMFLVGAASLALTVYAAVASSGLNVGDNVFAFHPYHVLGPDAKTNTCPPCKYGARPAVQVWINGDSKENVAKIIKALSAEVKEHSGKEFKAFALFVTDKDSKTVTEQEVTKMGAPKGIENVGIIAVNENEPWVGKYKINLGSDVKNTIFVYKDKVVTAKFVNLTGDKGVSELKSAVDKITK